MQLYTNNFQGKIYNSPKEWCLYTGSGNNSSISAGAPIEFNTKISGNMTSSGTPNYSFTLKAGILYQIEAAIPVTGSLSNSEAYVGIYDLTNSVYIGKSGNARSATSTLPGIVPETAVVLHRPSTDINVQARITGIASVTAIDNTYAFIRIQSLEDWNMPVDPDLNYSTSEVNTGRKWTGGQAIYRKTIVFTSASGINQSTATSLTSLNIETIINYFGFLNDNGGVNWQLNCYAHGNGSTIYSSTTTTALTVLLWGNAYPNWYSRPITVTIEYTKTA